jgi:gamma-glutamylputrescine oxidase
VGGGVAGLSCAQRLINVGVRVAVVEADFCGSGASGRSSGFITPASEIELASLVSSRGAAEAKRLWEFVLSGVEAIRGNVVQPGFACDYREQDSLFVASGRLGMRAVEAEHRARASLGYASQLYRGAAIRTVLGASGYAGAVRYGPTFGIDAYLYCQALRDWLVEQGVGIYESSPVVGIRKDGVDTANGRVDARNVVVCADRFIPALGALEKEIYHVQTFLGISTPVASSELDALFPTAEMMVWDSDLVYGYFRRAGENRVLVGGGNIRQTYARGPARDTLAAARHLKTYFDAHCPRMSITFDRVWSGMLGVSKDLLPVMGPHPLHDTIWCAGAATGLPWAAAIGTYAAERIAHCRSELDTILSPSRRFVIGRRLQAILSTPLTYALTHAVAKLS